MSNIKINPYDYHPIGRRVLDAWQTVQLALVEKHTYPLLVIFFICISLGVLAWGGWLILQNTYFATTNTLQTTPIPPTEEAQLATANAAPHNQQNIHLLKEAPWFGTPPKAEKDEDAETLKETKLKLALMGTIMVNTPRAVITNKNEKTTKVYAVGEEILPQVTLQQVNRREVVVLNKGKAEKLSLPGINMFLEEKPEVVTLIPEMLKKNQSKQKAPPKKAAKYTFLFDRPVRTSEDISVPKTLVSDALKNIGSLSSDIRFIRRVAGETMEGVKIAHLEKNSLFAKDLNLKEGDILIKLDGLHLSEEDQILPKIMSLATARRVEVLLHRNNQNRLMIYTTN